MIKKPEPEQVRQVRLDANLTQTQAAKVVYVDLRSWQRWETGDIQIPQAAWELFLIKTKQGSQNEYV